MYKWIVITVICENKDLDMDLTINKNCVPIYLRGKNNNL